MGGGARGEGGEARCNSNASDKMNDYLGPYV